MLAEGIGFALFMLVPVWYLWQRVGLRFCARSLFIALFVVVAGYAHLYYAYAYMMTPWLFRRVTLVLVIMWIGVLVSMELVWRMHGGVRKRTEATLRGWRDLPFIDDFSRNRLLLPLSFGVGLFLLVVWLAEGKYVVLAEFLAVAGQKDEVAVLRGTAGGSGVYLYNLLVASVAPFLSFVLVIKARLYKTPTYLYSALFLVSQVMLGKASLLTRSALAIYMLQLLFLFGVARSNRISLRRSVAVLATCGLFVFPFFVHYLGELTLADFFGEYFLSRVLVMPYVGILNYFALIPEWIPHSWGKGVSLINLFFYGGVEHRPAMILFAEMAGNYYGSFNAMFIAEAWAEFAWIGVAAVSFVLGGTLSFIDLHVFSRGRTLSSVAVITCLSYSMWVLASGALQTSMWSGGMVLVPVAAMLIRAIGKERGRRALRNEPQLSGPHLVQQGELG